MGARAEDPDDGAVTVVGTGALRKARLVVRAFLEKVSMLELGVEMAVVRPAETLWGDAPKRETFRLMTNEPGYFARVSSDAVFFLTPTEGGGRYTCSAVVDLGGPDGEARLAALRRSLEVERRPREERPAAVRALCFEGLGAADAWTRRNAGREVAHLASTVPEAFSAGDARDLQRLAFRERDPVLRPLLVETAESLSLAAARGRLAVEAPGAVTLRGAPLLRRLREDPDPGRRRSAAEAVAREGPAGEAALAEALERDRDEGVRAAAAEALGTTVPSAATVQALLRRLREDAAPAVRTAAAEALGVLKVEEAVPALRGAFGADPALARAALFSLARIRSASALSALQAVRREAAASDAAGSRETRELADFLLSDDFLRQEEILRRIRTGD